LDAANLRGQPVTTSTLSRPPAPWRDLLLLAALALALLSPGIGARSLWNPDEPRYAEVTREMLASGEWFLPHLNDELYSEKPPLLFWSMAVAATLRGSLDETAVRLPSLFAGVGATLMVFLLARRLFDHRSAWLAALVYLSSAKLQWQARVGQIDMLLGFAVVLAMWCWVRGWQEQRPGLPAAGRWPSWRLLLFAVAGVGTVAKGPVALLPILFGILAFLLLEGDRAELRRLPIVKGLLLWAGVVLAWLGPALLRGGHFYFERIVLKQNLTRYADPWHHHQPWHYYLTTALPADFLPWIVLLPAALVAWRRDANDEERRGLRLAACWALATLVFFSLSPAKRTVYVFQMFPALALLVGAGLAIASRRATAYRRLLAWPLGGLATLLLVAPLALPAQARRHPEVVALRPELVPLVGGLVVALGLGLLAAAWLYGRGRVRAGTATAAASFALSLTFVFAVILPRFDVFKSARPLAATLVAVAAPDEPYAIYPRFDAPFVFYSERYATDISGEAELAAFLARPGRVWLLIERDDLAKRAGPLVANGPLVEVARDPDPKEGYLLLRKDPAPAAADAPSP
jgi:4-amino-4-deoxy-L-arabinose transferase-like glycosyltransferase